MCIQKYRPIYLMCTYAYIYIYMYSQQLLVYTEKSIKIFWFKLITNFAMLTNPQEVVACNGVHPSLSPLFTSAPCSTKNSTMSRLSSIQA